MGIKLLFESHNKVIHNLVNVLVSQCLSIISQNEADSVRFLVCTKGITLINIEKVNILKKIFFGF